MLKSLALLSVFATLAAANAQSTTPPEQDSISQAAPIVRTYQANGTAMHRPRPQQPHMVDSQPISGVWLRSDSSSALTTISATPQHAEIRLDHGRLNVSVHQPAQHTAILIDLPGGQTSLLKDGLYTFNADTNTVRVLRGEAAAYPGPISPNADVKPIKIKEDHQLSLMAATDGAKPVESYSYELTADLLPLGNAGDRAYAGGGYGDGFYGGYPGYGGYSPYFADGWGYPGYYGYGYPYGIGLGFGYYGGFGGYGRGFGGGYGHGFGGGFHGGAHR